MKKNKQLLKMIRQLVDASFSNEKINERQVVKSIKILKTLPASKAILAISEFLKELKRKEREHTLYIETATPLSVSLVNKMRKIVEKKSLSSGKSVKISKVLVNINPEILGGFKLWIGDEIWDESVLEKIHQIEEVISR